MSVVAENRLPGGGYVRLHNDYVPTDEKERTARIHAFEAVVANLISSGQIKIDGAQVGDKVECTLIDKRKGGIENEKCKRDSRGNCKGQEGCEEVFGTA